MPSGPLASPSWSRISLACLGSSVECSLREPGPALNGVFSAGAARPGSPWPEPEDLVELVAVDAQRERDAKVLVGQPFADFRVGIVVLVDEEAGIAAMRPLPEADRVVALLLVLFERRQLGDIHVPDLEVVLAGDRAQVGDLEILGQAPGDRVDVRQLVTVGIDGEVVRIALADRRSAR